MAESSPAWAVTVAEHIAEAAADEVLREVAETVAAATES
jgi:hypothetical protein